MKQIYFYFFAIIFSQQSLAVVDCQSREALVGFTVTAQTPTEHGCHIQVELQYYQAHYLCPLAATAILTNGISLEAVSCKLLNVGNAGSGVAVLRSDKIILD